MNKHYYINPSGKLEKTTSFAWLRHQDVYNAMPNNGELLSIEPCCNIIGLVYTSIKTGTVKAYVLKANKPDPIKNSNDFICLANRIEYTDKSNKINNYPQEIELCTHAYDICNED